MTFEIYLENLQRVGPCTFLREKEYDTFFDSNLLATFDLII